jgi:hypothetical protein
MKFTLQRLLGMGILAIAPFIGAQLASASATEDASSTNQNLKVTVGGRIDFMHAGVSQKKEFRTNNPFNPAAGKKLQTSSFAHDTKLDIKADATSPDGTFTYGGLIRLNADVSHASNGKQSNADKVMVYVQNNKIGRLEAGSYPGAGGMFEMDTKNIAKGTYGVYGFSGLWMNNRTIRVERMLAMLGQSLDEGTAAYEYTMLPNLFSNYSGRYYSDANKATIYTMPLEWLKIGVSYIPDLDSVGTSKGIAWKNGPAVDDRKDLFPPTFRNVWSGGLQYEFDLKDEYKIKGSLVGEIGDSKVPEIRDLKAYEIALQLRKGDIAIAGAYGDWGKSGTFKQKVAGTKQGAHYWYAGFSQDISDFGYSVTYLNSEKAGGIEMLANKMRKVGAPTIITDGLSDRGYNKFENVGIDLEYRLAPGLLPYVGVARFKYKGADRLKANAGTVVLTGMRLIF